MKRIYLIGAVVSIVLTSCSPGEEEKDPIPMKRVGADKVIVSDFEHWVELQGALESDDDVRLTPQTAGIISRIYVKEGQRVSKGQIIALMDSDIISKNVEEVQTALDNAEYVYGKQVSLFKKGVGTEFDTTQAYNQVESLRRKISTLRAQAGKSAVVAPFSGYVEEIYPSQGEVGGPQSPICHLVGLRSILATAAISESYFQDITAGSRVKIEIPALDTTIMELEISRVSKYVNPNNRTYQIHVDLDNPNDLLVPNLVAKIFVRDKMLRSTTIVNGTSVQYDKDGNTYVFWLEPIKGDKKKTEKKSKDKKGDKEKTENKSETGDQNYKAHLVLVEKISSYGGKTAIKFKSEVPKGSQIVTIGAEGIEDGDEVNVSF